MTRVAAIVAGERALLLAGSAAMAVYLGSIAQSRLYQARAERTFESAIREEGPAASVPRASFSLRDPDTSDWSLAKIDAFRAGLALDARPPLARLSIPSVGLNAMVLEGTDETALVRGVGHIEGTARPGEAGNVGLAGHRDSFFRRLSKIAENQEIVLSTLEGGDVRYVVRAIDIVPPERLDVLAPTTRPTLTLVTCYPFYFIGPAPMRYVVRAERIEGSGVGVVTPWRPPDAAPNVTQ